MLLPAATGSGASAFAMARMGKVTGWIEIAPIVRGFEAPRVQDMVTEAAPGLVLAPPRISLPLLPVLFVYLRAWPGSWTSEPESPLAVTTSRTTSLRALATVIAGVAPVPSAPAKGSFG